MRTYWVLVAMAALLAGCGSAPVGPTPTQPSPPPSGSALACPAGSADQPGDPARPRPALPDPNLKAAMDPTGPRIVVGETGFVPEGAVMSTLQSTWAFDVCTNAWTELDDTSLPTPEQRPALATFVTDPRAGVVQGIPVWWIPLWTFDPATDSWSAPEAERSGFESSPNAVYDSASDRLLAFDAWGLAGTGLKDSGVRAYEPAAGGWSDVRLADPAQQKPTLKPQFAHDVAYDNAAHRLVLVVTPVGFGDPAQTWTFDPVIGTWSQGADVLNHPGEGSPAGRLGGLIRSGDLAHVVVRRHRHARLRSTGRRLDRGRTRRRLARVHDAR